MNRTMNRIALLAGMTMLTGIAAFAQNLKGTVPFNFTAGRAELPAGTYQFERQATVTPTWIVRNVDTGKRVVLVSASGAQRPAAESDTSALTFRCAGEQCGLQALHGAGAVQGFRFSIYSDPGPSVQVATIRTVQFTD